MSEQCNHVVSPKFSLIVSCLFFQPVDWLEFSVKTLNLPNDVLPGNVVPKSARNVSQVFEVFHDYQKKNKTNFVGSGKILQ